MSLEFPIEISLFGNELISPPAHYQGGAVFWSAARRGGPLCDGGEEM
jgi:hypothetical protein